MTILQSGAIASAGGYQIERSLRFNSADSAYLNRTPASAGNRKTFTWSGWVKRGALSSSASYFLFAAGSFAGSTNTSIRILNDSINIYWGGTGGPQWTATAVLRDPSAWYHLVFAFDTTQATFGNRLKLYVNGVQSTVWSLQETGGLTAQNSDLYINNNQQHNLGASGTPGNYFDGYMTEINFIDGQALTPSSFGETDSATGVWKPKAYSGTYGTNGFYLNFSDNSGTTSTTLGKDYSGNGNNWTPNNFSVTAGAGNDSLVDSPTAYGTDTGVGGEVRGNYATLNPLINPSADTFSNGNLQVVTSSSNYGTSVSSIALPTTGKWYAECTIVATASYAAVGICSTSSVFTATSWIGSLTGVTYYGNTGNKFVNATGSSYGATYGANDVIGVAYDADNLQITFYKNNTTQGLITGVTAGTYYFGSSEWDTASGTQVWNFGQRAFAYTAPSGFKALCTQNLPTPTIGATSTTQANDYMNVVLYTGTSASTQTVTGVGFQPDFVWVKSRSLGVGSLLYDAVRGAGSSKALQSNATDYEGLGFNVTAASSRGYISSFDSDGFTAADGSSSGQYSKANTSTYVSWNWKANGAGSSNTAGSITSTVSANTTAGFSVVGWVGTAANATVGHGLGAVPSMLIIKERGVVDNWAVYHVSIGNQRLLNLNNTNAQSGTSAAYWNNTTPTSTVFSVGTDNKTNGSNAAGMICYAFAPVAGYSDFGSYTGNGSATDGTFVYLGFRPRFLMIKSTSAGTSWVMMDSVRNTYNLADTSLYADSFNSETTIGTVNDIDFLSNGFKLRNNTGFVNASQTYVYAAFAESPFKYALAR